MYIDKKWLLVAALILVLGAGTALAYTFISPTSVIVDEPEEEEEEDPIVDEEEPVETDGAITFTKHQVLDAKTLILANKDKYKEPTTWDRYSSEAEFYQSLTTQNERNIFTKVGEFNSGKYEGYDLVVLRTYCDSMCPYAFHRVAMKGSDWVLLANHSSEYLPGDEVPFMTVDKTTVLEEFELPKELTIHEDTAYMLREPVSKWASELEGVRKAVYNHPYYKTYYESDCIYLEAPDGLVARYFLVPKAFDESFDVEGFTMVKTLTVKDTNGASITNDYALTAGGCGFFFSCVSQYSATAKEELVLQTVGTLNGEPLYGVKRVDGERNQLIDATLAAYSAYKSRLEYSGSKETPMTALEYSETLNFFFIKLDNGKYVGVFNNDYAPVAECGKPVVYLYPEVPMPISVKVLVDELTITIPEHGPDGWNVYAYPNGQIINLADNKQYPYLFWEGHDYENWELDAGWTLKKSEVARQLPKALKGMGLKWNERKDFMAFWMPLIQDLKTPYVQFNFVGTEKLNEVMPLQVNPVPENMLRIFMLFQGTNNPGFKMPEYHAPDRSGYSLIEWGGQLL